MESEQITLLNHVVKELRKTKVLLAEKGQPLPLETGSVAKNLGISSSTLSRAKRQDKLPYKRYWKSKIAETYFSHTEKGKDYWIVWVKEAN